MAPNRRERRVYSRKQGKGGTRRYYLDVRDFADVLRPDEAPRQALIGEGQSRATDDELIAQVLATRRLTELQERRRTKVLTGLAEPAHLKRYAKHHLQEKAKAGNVVERHLVQVQRRLEAAISFLGSERELTTIGATDVQAWASELKNKPNGRRLRCPECGTKGSMTSARPETSCPACSRTWRLPTLSGGTIRHYLNALSNLYQRAQSEQRVQPGYNPVAAMLDKPTGTAREAEWLEVHEAALLLESARTWDPDPDAVAIPFAYTLLATFLLTGGRKSEVLGLAVEDISFDRRTVSFRPNEHRRLKTRTSHRTVPLWPQLESILRDHLYGGEQPRVSGLLFPSPRTGKMLDNVKKALDAIAVRAGWNKGEIRTKRFRHTYCAARLQTLDRGAPVSPWTVAKEMGHGGRALVDRVYGHLGDVRHRSERPEYRIEQHAEQLGERLTALRAAAGG